MWFPLKEAGRVYNLEILFIPLVADFNFIIRKVFRS